MSGPAHLDPKKLIKQPTVRDNLQNILRGKDPKQRREDFVNSLYHNFATNMDNDTILTLSEFRKYEELFSQQLRQDYLDGNLPSEEVDRLTSLSQEFYERVNVQKPIHIVDDFTKEEVLPPIPPIHLTLRKLKGKGAEAVDIFHNAFARDDNTPQGTAMKNKATANLGRLIVMSQDEETINAEMAKYDEMAQNFHKKALGKPVFPENDAQAAAAAKQENNQVVSTNDGPDMFDFEPIDE